MVCPRCGRAVPDESTFCLGCGTRLVAPPHGLTANGDAAAGPGGSRPAPAPGPPAPAPSAPPPVGKQAYALSFRPIVDERLRYRVARWVCERAPAHALAEVQDELQRGAFVTFLALTAEEAEAARQGIQGLGVAPALLSFTPASAAQMLLPVRSQTPKSSAARGIRGKDLLAVLVAVVVLFVFGLVVIRLFGGRGF